MRQRQGKSSFHWPETHNAWHSDLVTAAGTRAGVEYATSSVTSPGFEALFGNDPETIGGLEQALTILIDNLHYLNASDRGYVMASFSNSVAQAEWRFVKTIAAKNTSTFTGHTASEA